MDALSIISTALPPALTGQSYSEQLQAIGGSPPYTNWALVSGSLPTGMSLSAAGVLSAAPGAIPDGSVGPYAFRVRVTDSVPSNAELDLAIDVVPADFDRVPEFQLDSRLRTLVGRFLSNQTERRKIERHFFRALLGVDGDTFSHLDRDVMVEDYPSPGSDTDLRTVINGLVSSLSQAIKTINTVPPDSSQDFEVRAGAGVSVAPLANGLEISASGVPNLAHHENSGPVTPGSSLVMPVTSAPHAIDARIKDVVNDRWYALGDIPDYAAKLVNEDIHLNSDGNVAVAVGDKSGSPVIHILWHDGSDFIIERYDGLTLVQEESHTLLTAACLGEPLCMCGPNGEVVVAFMVPGSPNLLYYGELNPSDYTDTSGSWFQPVSVPYTFDDMFPPRINTTPKYRLIGTIGYDSVPTYASYIAVWVTSGTIPTDNGAAVLEIPLGGGGTLSGYITEMNLGGGATGDTDTLDLAFDTSNLSLAWIISDQWGGGPSDLWMLAVILPFATVVVREQLIVSGGGVPFNLSDGDWWGPVSLALDPVLGLGTIALLPRDGNTSFLAGHRLWYVEINNYNAFVGGGAFVTGTPVQAREDFIQFPYECRFLRWWFGIPYFNTILLEPHLTTTGYAVRRAVFSALPTYGPPQSVPAMRELGDYLSRPGTDPMTDPPGLNWVRPAHTNTRDFPNTHQLRSFSVLGGVGVLAAADPYLDEQNLFAYYDESGPQIVLVNNSPFTWNVRLASLEVSGFEMPPNLLLACYSLGQGLRNFFTDAGFYPSPSTTGGVTWTESQLSASITSGFAFQTYYTVVPYPVGGYDLANGTVAVAYYYADATAGTASDQIVALRYVSNPVEITNAEAAINADIVTYIGVHGSFPHPGTWGAADPNYFTLAEMDTIMGTTHATTYAGPPWSFYKYFCFVDLAGTSYHQGFFSQNYIKQGLAYGPHPASSGVFPISQYFTVAADATPGVPSYFTLDQAVSAARLTVNGVQYYEGIDWEFAGPMNQIEYYNNPTPGGYPLHAGDIVAVEKWIA